MSEEYTEEMYNQREMPPVGAVVAYRDIGRHKWYKATVIHVHGDDMLLEVFKNGRCVLAGITGIAPYTEPTEEEKLIFAIGEALSKGNADFLTDELMAKVLVKEFNISFK